MIQEKDLRIGNLVLCGTKFIEVYSIYEDGINIDIQSSYEGSWTVDYEGIFADNIWNTNRTPIVGPIPITEEILLKCGFEYDDQEEEYEKEGITLFKENSEWKYYLGDKGWQRGTLIEYLHKIQNLYFALTGQELNVDSLK